MFTIHYKAEKEEVYHLLSKGLSQSEIARALGVTRQAISLIVKGKKKDMKGWRKMKGKKAYRINISIPEEDFFYFRENKKLINISKIAREAVRKALNEARDELEDFKKWREEIKKNK